MDELTAWSLYHANILGMLLHPGHAKLNGEYRTDQHINDYAAYLADLALHTWRIRCIQFNTEKNSSSAQAHSSEASYPQAPPYTETSAPPPDKPAPTPQTGTSTNKT